jgi:RNA polymerase sigma factor (sigma-70 family)
MDKPLVEILYTLADGKRICLEVSIEVKDLLAQADRQIRSQRRQDRRYLSNEEYIEGLTDTTTVNPHEDIADLIDRMDSYKRLYAAIETLPETQKRWVLLYYIENFTYRQIAKMEGVHHTTVMRTILKAHKLLKQFMQE